MASSRTTLLVAACILLSAGHAMAGFPYCSCERGGEAKAPYLLTLASEVPQSDGSTYVCYNLITTNPYATGSCTQYDLRKIEFDVNVGCRGAVETLTFNGVDIAPSYAAYPDKDALVFKITKSTNGVLGTYTDLSKQTNKVCYTLAAGQCSTAATFLKDSKSPVFFNPTDDCCLSNGVLPPPPPPPPTINVPVGFPYCGCSRKVPELTYTVSGAGDQPPSERNHCFNVYARQAVAGRCTNYDLKKIEISVGPQCRGSVVSITFNGQTISPSYASYPDKRALVLKVTHGSRPLGLHADLVGKNSLLCITLKPSSACPTMATLSPSRLVSTFSNDHKCCPVSSLY